MRLDDYDEDSLIYRKSSIAGIAAHHHGTSQRNTSPGEISRNASKNPFIFESQATMSSHLPLSYPGQTVHSGYINLPHGNQLGYGNSTPAKINNNECRSQLYTEAVQASHVNSSHRIHSNVSDYEYQNQLSRNHSQLGENFQAGYENSSHRNQVGGSAYEHQNFPEFDNRFTSMKINRDVLVRTRTGFIGFFNANSHLILKDAWENEIVPRTRLEQSCFSTAQSYHSDVNGSVESDSDIEFLEEIIAQPHVLDITLVKEEKILSSSSQLCNKSNPKPQKVNSPHTSPIIKSEKIDFSYKQTAWEPGTSECHSENQNKKQPVVNKLLSSSSQMKEVSSRTEADHVLETSLSSLHSKSLLHDASDNKNRIEKVRNRFEESLITEDLEMKRRCRRYLNSQSCALGTSCNFLHSFPKNENIFCKNNLSGKCSKSNSECWFKHKEGNEIKRVEEIKVEMPCQSSVPLKTVDKESKFRCRSFLRKGSCAKGSECKFLHSLPKDDNILCNDFVKGNCKRSAAECLFKHNEKKLDVNKIKSEDYQSNENEEINSVSNDNRLPLHSIGYMLSMLRKSTSEVVKIQNVESLQKSVGCFRKSTDKVMKIQNVQIHQKSHLPQIGMAHLNSINETGALKISKPARVGASSRSNIKTIVESSKSKETPKEDVETSSLTVESTHQASSIGYAPGKINSSTEFDQGKTKSVNGDEVPISNQLKRFESQTAFTNESETLQISKSNSNSIQPVSSVERNSIISIPKLDFIQNKEKLTHTTKCKIDKDRGKGTVLTDRIVPENQIIPSPQKDNILAKSDNRKKDSNPVKVKKPELPLISNVTKHLLNSQKTSSVSPSDSDNSSVVANQKNVANKNNTMLKDLIETGENENNHKEEVIKGKRESNEKRKSNASHTASRGSLSKGHTNDKHEKTKEKYKALIRKDEIVCSTGEVKKNKSKERRNYHKNNETIIESVKRAKSKVPVSTPKEVNAKKVAKIVDCNIGDKKAAKIVKESNGLFEKINKKEEAEERSKHVKQQEKRITSSDKRDKSQECKVKKDKFEKSRYEIVKDDVEDSISPTKIKIKINKDHEDKRLKNKVSRQNSRTRRIFYNSEDEEVIGNSCREDASDLVAANKIVSDELSDNECNSCPRTNTLSSINSEILDKVNVLEDEIRTSNIAKGSDNVCLNRTAGVEKAHKRKGNDFISKKQRHDHKRRKMDSEQGKNSKAVEANLLGKQNHKHQKRKSESEQVNRSETFEANLIEPESTNVNHEDASFRKHHHKHKRRKSESEEETRLKIVETNLREKEMTSVSHDSSFRKQDFKNKKRKRESDHRSETFKTKLIDTESTIVSLDDSSFRNQHYKHKRRRSDCDTKARLKTLETDLREDDTSEIPDENGCQERELPSLTQDPVGSFNNIQSRDELTENRKVNNVFDSEVLKKAKACASDEALKYESSEVKIEELPIDITDEYVGIRVDEYGLPLYSVTPHEELIIFVKRVLGPEGAMEGLSFDELYSKMLVFSNDLYPDVELLKSDKSDPYILMEANLRIIITCTYQTIDEGMAVRDSILQHWAFEPSLNKYKKRLILEKISGCT